MLALRAHELHWDDITHRYCGGCHRFHAVAEPPPVPSALQEHIQRVAAALGVSEAPVREGLQSLPQLDRSSALGPEVDYREMEGTTIDEIIEKWKSKGSQT